MTTTELLRSKLRRDEEAKTDLDRRIADSATLLAAHFAPVRDALNELHRDGVMIRMQGQDVIFPEVSGSKCSLQLSYEGFPYVLYDDMTRYILMDTRTTRYFNDAADAVDAFLEAILPYLKIDKPQKASLAKQEGE